MSAFEASPRTLTDAFTPALVLDRSRLIRNAERMRARARDLGVALRPHVKTSKSLPVTDLLLEGGPSMVTVSTLAEAAAMLRHGVRDVLYAVGIVPTKLAEASRAATAGSGQLTLAVDAVESAHAIAALAEAGGPAFPALIEIDSDGSRAGLLPQDGEQLRAIATALAPQRQLRGVMTHAGASYGGRGPDEFAEWAERERLAVTLAAAILTEAGHAIDVVSVGSTPSATFARNLAGVTEVRAGVYAFQDLYQTGLGVAQVEDIAVSVLASVISRQPARDRLLTDAGFLALSRDRSTASLAEDWGFGRVSCLADATPIGDLMIGTTNQEHSRVVSRAGSADPFALSLGERVRILPNHACATAAGHRSYLVVDGDSTIIDRWDRIGGWAP